MEETSSCSIILLSVAPINLTLSFLLTVVFSYRKTVVFSYRKKKITNEHKPCLFFFPCLDKWSLAFIGICLLYKPVFAQYYI